MNRFIKAIIPLLCLAVFSSCSPSNNKTTKALEKIEVKDMTTTYLLNSSFSFDGKCIATYSDESTLEVTPTSVSGGDTSSLGNHTVTVKFTDKNVTKSTNYSILVYEQSEEIHYVGITVSGQSTSFIQGDEFVFDGQVKLITDKGEEVTITSGYMVSSINMEQLGSQEVTVSYTCEDGTFSITYTITITEEEKEDDTPGYITLSERHLEIEKGSNKTTYLTVDFIDCEHEYDVYWTSSNVTIATVSQYGGVKSAKQNTGKAIITCTTAKGKRATCSVTVVDHIKEKNPVWDLVTNPDLIVPGDIIVMASPENGVTASLENTGMYLHPVASTFNRDYSRITSLGEGTIEFMVGGEVGALTLETQTNQYLASTHLGKVTFVNNKGNIHWDIHRNDYDVGSTDAVIESEVETHGYFMYNIKQYKFTTYDSNIQEGLLVLPKLYKLNYV